MGELLHLLGPALGGLLAPVSKYFQGRQQLEGKRIDNKHEEIMADKRVAELEAEAKASIQVAAEETRGKTVEAAYRAFGSSIRRDQAAGASPGLSPWVQDVRALLVPFVVAAATTGLFVELLSGAPNVAVTNVFGLPYGWLFGHFMTGGFEPKTPAPAPAPVLGWDNLLQAAGEAEEAKKAK